METTGEAIPLRPRGFDIQAVIKKRATLVQNFALFSGIPFEDCAKIVALAHEVNLKRGKTVFFEGDSIRQVLLVTSGCAKLSQTSIQGQEVILRLIGAGETLCVECHPKFTHASTAQVVERSSLLVWEAAQFDALRHRFPLLASNVSRVLLQTLNQLEVRFREISTEKVASRLSSQLVRLATQVGKQSDGQFEIALSQRELAQLTGTTLFTVSRLFGQWEAQGIVKPQRQGVIVLNLQALADLSAKE